MVTSMMSSVNMGAPLNFTLRAKIAKHFEGKITHEEFLLQKINPSGRKRMLTSMMRKLSRKIRVFYVDKSIRCNTDSSTRVSSGHAVSGGILRDYRGAILGCFSSYTGVSFAHHAELIVAMTAIEIAFQNGCNRLWLECDSQLVVAALSSNHIVPWNLRNGWNDCSLSVSKMCIF